MKERSKTQKMVLIAVLADLAIVMYMLSYKTESMNITLYGLPLLVAGMMYGPKIGGLSGLVVGVITQLLTYGPSPTMPLWLIAPALWGFLSGVVAIVLKKNYKITNVALIVFITSLTVTSVNSVAMYLDGIIGDYPTPYVMGQLFLRFGLSILCACIYTYSSYEILKRISKVKTLQI